MNYRKKNLYICITFFMLFTFLLEVDATPINSHVASTITVKTIDLETKEELSNVPVTIYQIKQITDYETPTFEYIDAFKNIELSSEELTPIDHSEYLYEYITKNSIEGITKISNGKVTFKNLPLGTYLVVIGTFTKGNMRYDCAPFIVDVPTLNKDTWHYEIVATPKVMRFIESANDEKLPETSNYLYSVTLLGVIGCLFIILGHFIIKRARK